VAAQATQLIADTWMARLDEIQNLCCDTTCDASGKKPIPTKTRECKTNEQQSNFWLKGIGKYGTQDNVNGMNGYKTDAVGVMLGYDVPVTERTRVGLGAGYVRSNIDGNNSDNRTKIDSYHLTAYFNYAPDAFFLQGAVTAGVDKYDGTRNIVFPGISRQATSDATGQQYSATINAGKHFGLNETTITPLVGLKATRIYVEGYQESGAGDVNLRVDSQTYDFLQSSVGLKAERVIQTAKGSFAPEVHAKWLHDFNSTTMEQNALFTGGGAKFNMQGIVQDRDTYNVGAGVTFLTCNCDQTSWSVKGLYDYKWNGSHYDSHQVSLIAGLRF
jgi:outer membrane autotransporter protein